MKDDKWKSIQKDPPGCNVNSIGHFLSILLGAHIGKGTGIEQKIYQTAFVHRDGTIIDLETKESANISYWTHWREIPEVPE